jgi:hypothetical protein
MSDAIEGHQQLQPRRHHFFAIWLTAEAIFTLPPLVISVIITPPEEDIFQNIAGHCILTHILEYIAFFIFSPSPWFYYRHQILLPDE